MRLPLATQIDAPAEDSAATDPFLAEQLIADPMRLRDLETRYRLRKEALFDGLYAVLAVPHQRAAEADWDGIATQLLRLATVAANFGDDRLGDLARTLHGEFDAQPHPRLRHELLCRWWPVLLEAR